MFSLRSHDSFGVGDFGDLRKMIDWVSMTRQRLLQILPINDTTTTHTWTDSYPYSCISYRHWPTRRSVLASKPCARN